MTDPSTTARPPADPPVSDRPVRWGLLAAGGIARALAQAIAAVDGGEVVAVAARDGGRARAFADEFGIPRAYGSYDELMADPEVDAVYISSTHPFHRDQALACIEAGKHVLVEKPTTLTVRDTEEVLEAAREAGVLAVEAMWTRCQPIVLDALARVRGGDIGTVRSFHAAFPVPFEYDESHRLFDLDNGGGALLDLGIYPVTLAHLLVGHPTHLHVLGSRVATGADALVSLQWMTEEGAVVQVLTDSLSHGSTETIVRGTEGSLQLHGPLNNPTSFTVRRGEHEELVSGGDRRGYEHEVEEFHRCLAEGLLESPLVPHADTVAIMTILESARRELGVRYPQEEEPLQTTAAVT
ncbi:putative oxidoreductase [Serinicoccus hydrothermalis]|uniref:Putative oxidoreductase n=1 Tax=Serinicoccus hydrothermalis TaxID=1758689 RepID=A0A1B1NGW1_9MICO|nr:Gfo/Idh/MocA family oxidoreductase [Serinicoccus hydrothermalis]ANS80650.1 putative oxidoreductase [Serinicoccus hydrothermalis]